MKAQRYDYIIAGMGCAGLSLAVQLSAAGLTRGKKILLIDRERKDVNNRTWCFWETQPGFFENIVFKSWRGAWFHSSSHSALLDLHPYHYKMIRGLDFNTYCLKMIKQDPAFEVVHDEVISIHSEGELAECTTTHDRYEAPWIFSSIIFDKPAILPDEYFLLQHFKGWVIKSPKPVFDPARATLMDFRPSQQKGTTFVYVMPFTPTEALVEYTLFTPSLLDDTSYDRGLNNYIREHIGIEEWEVVEEEFGVIPMTNHRFPKSHNRIIHIGTAGGMTKASSGYTFRFIQKDTAEIIRQLQKTGRPERSATWAKRFQWYDSVLLNILHHQTLQGDAIFTDLFKFNAPDKILKFLDNETTLAEDMKIMWSLPQWPFMKAGIAEALK
jgi:lycopene beta-cyclase